MVDSFPFDSGESIRPAGAAAQPSRQNGESSPTEASTACDSATVRGRQDGSRRSGYQARARRQVSSRVSVAPVASRSRRHQRSTCSSDRKSRIVAQV